MFLCQKHWLQLKLADSLEYVDEKEITCLIISIKAIG